MKPFCRSAGAALSSLVMLVAAPGPARAGPVAAAGTVTYHTLWNGQAAPEEGTLELVYRDGVEQLRQLPQGTLIPTAPREATYVDFAGRTTIRIADFAGGARASAASSHDSLPAIVPTTEHAKILGFDCVKATATQRSNHYELWFTRGAGIRGSPSPDFLVPDGLILRLVRNGNYELVADRVSPGMGGGAGAKDDSAGPLLPADRGTALDLAAYRARVTDAWVTRVDVFEHEQLSWGNDIANPPDSLADGGAVCRYAGGTVVARRVDLPDAPDDAMVIADVCEVSNGDAYDRLGSVFVIPRDRRISFLDALRSGVGALPVTTDRDGRKYQGITATPDYLPPLELVRFITPFGIGAYNRRSVVAGLTWEDSVTYRVDVTDLLPVLRGPVWIGAFIGNYDKGGHIVSLRLSYYPGSREVNTAPPARRFTLPLFNTVNAMEMAGQEYGRIFLHDTLTVAFDAPAGLQHPTLRYLSTGHGGWEHGDEFNAKTNTVLLDDRVAAMFTPWRTDCACFRRWNPSSGNFWNGVSSSDLSRSGWCPGAAVNPVEIALPDLAAGHHTLRVAIPMGEPEGNSWSGWNVSGVLVGELAKQP